MGRTEKTRDRKDRSRSKERHRRKDRSRSKGKQRRRSESAESPAVAPRACELEVLLPDSTHGGGNGDVAVIRRAAALRAKYKKYSTLTRIAVMQIGSHPDNRDGQGPSGARCVELTSQILGLGFDAVEVDANGVLVEQKPGSTHIADKKQALR